MWGPAAAGPPTPKHAGLASLSAHRKTQCGRLPRAEPLLREARVARTANSALLAVAPRTPTAALCACHPPPTPPLCLFCPVTLRSCGGVFEGVFREITTCDMPLWAETRDRETRERTAAILKLGPASQRTRQGTRWAWPWAWRLGPGRWGWAARALGGARWAVLPMCPSVWPSAHRRTGV